MQVGAVPQWVSQSVSAQSIIALGGFTSQGMRRTLPEITELSKLFPELTYDLEELRL